MKYNIVSATSYAYRGYIVTLYQERDMDRGDDGQGDYVIYEGWGWYVVNPKEPIFQIFLDADGYSINEREEALHDALNAVDQYIRAFYEVED